jgi:hypothetical protein
MGASNRIKVILSNERIEYSHFVFLEERSQSALIVHTRIVGNSLRNDISSLAGVSPA